MKSIILFIVIENKDGTLDGVVIPDVLRVKSVVQ